ncbi:MAG: histidine kinase, partial [Massilia sp.]
LLGASARAGSLSASLVVAVGVLGAVLKAYAWLGLFGLVLLPLAAVCALLAAARRAFQVRLDWPSVWLITAAGLVTGCALAMRCYRWWMAHTGINGLGDIQAMVGALVCASVILVLPLWQGQRQGRALHLAALRQVALAAELKALQAQVEPHFLYNTLANTRYLARHDPDKAVAMLDHLISYLRSALPDMRAESATLGREFELAGHYLALIAIRFGARLDYTLDCPAELAEARVPPLMLMSLVENAVQHGLEPQPGAVRIALLADAGDGALTIRVLDNGAGLARSPLGSGVGLRNVRERLAALFGEAGRFTLREREDGQTEAMMRLPLALPGARA